MRDDYSCWGFPLIAVRMGEVKRLELPEGFRAERMVFGSRCPCALLAAYDDEGARVDFVQTAPTQYVFEPSAKRVRALLLVATDNGRVGGGAFGVSQPSSSSRTKGMN